MLNFKKPHYKQVKWVVITLTICLVLMAVITNKKPIEFNVGMIVIIWLFESSYIIPYIEKKDMFGGMAVHEYNQDNMATRRIIMIFAVFVCVLTLY